MLQPGDKAPDFSGINQRGEPVSLSGLRGKKVILYFYPKDNTPGCTAEACSLNDKNAYFLEKGYVIIGVSPDSLESHQKFASQYGLSFHLIPDPDKKIIQAYGVWGEKTRCGKTTMGVLRTTFIISEDGIIQHVIPKVDTKTHADQIIRLLAEDNAS
jgi:peroxiredoxin Q/BCP